MRPTWLYHQDLVKFPFTLLPVTHFRPFSRNHSDKYPATERKVGSYKVLKREVNKEKIRFFLPFFFDKDENASQVAEIVNGVYGADTITANYVQFCFRRFRSGIFNVKDAPHTGRLVVENVFKITEIIEVNRHVSNRSIAQELKIDHKTDLPFAQSWIQKEAPCWEPHQLTPKNMMDQESICEA
ncbi:histone-lysine N-methyltransferase SETMAR [Trichonephila clavipes]|nr:histone-lysine N-methyltransferase SETMAR [Trichonephila clavipes]